MAQRKRPSPKASCTIARRYFMAHPDGMRTYNAEPENESSLPCDSRPFVETPFGLSKRVMDDTTLGKLSEVNDALVEHLKWLLEKKDLDALSRVIPIVDNLTRVLIEIGQTSQRT